MTAILPMSKRSSSSRQSRTIGTASTITSIMFAVSDATRSHLVARTYFGATRRSARFNSPSVALPSIRWTRRWRLSNTSVVGAPRDQAPAITPRGSQIDGYSRSKRL